MKFDQYSIAQGIKTSISKLGYKKPTDIQFKSIPAILKGEDVLAIAQTGTGKTAAFAIPILHKIHESKMRKPSKHVKCLIMAPTHELALQIEVVFQSLGKKTKAKAICIHGGVDQAPQIAELQRGVDIVIATPGRMFDLVSQGALNLKKLEILVLDEADHMLDLGFIKDIRDLMRHVPKRRQTLFFSATIDDEIKKIAYSLVTNAIRIQISPKDPVAKNIEHGVAFIEMEDKRFYLENLIRNHSGSKMLVFVRTKVRAERVKKAMERVNIDTDTIHSDKTQVERDLTMANFKKGSNRVLIATDISARGIDISGVDFVINYDLPETAEHYVHRVGRTGRGNEKGQAISFCSKEERPILVAIEENMGKPVKRIVITKTEHQETLNLSSEKPKDWKSLIDDFQREEDQFKKRKKKKKK